MSDPSLSPVTVSPFLSVVEGRTPRQKLHKRISDAKNAFATPKLNHDVEHPTYKRSPTWTHGWGQLYEFNGSEWKLLYDIPQPEQKDLVREDHSWGATYDWETRPWMLEGKK